MKRETLVDQVYAHLLEWIGNMQPDQNKLPSEETLSNTLGVSRPTVREVLKRLLKDGYITTVHGVGTFAHPSLLKVKGRLNVTTDFLVLLQQQYDDVQVENTYVGVGEGSDAFACEFGYREKHVYRMSWTYKADGKPTIRCEYEFPVDMFRAFPKDDAKYTDLETFSNDCLYRRISYCSMRLSAEQNPTVAKRFGIEENTVLLRIDEKIFDMHDHAIGFASCYIHPSNMQLTMTVQFGND